MRFRLPHVFLTLAATAGALAAPAAHAFSVENKDEGGQYGVPKFNLEEQAKGFRKGDTSAFTAGKSDFSTPIGSGTLSFGVTQGPSGFGSMLSPGLGLSGSSQNSRQEFERRLAPPSSLEYNNVR
jgi:hypothetical protein